MSKDKNIDIYIFGMKQELFEFIFPQISKNIDENDFGLIEKRIKIIEIKQPDEDPNLFELILPSLLLYIVENIKKIYLNGYNYPELLENNYKKIILDLFKKINLSENKNTIIIKFGKSYIKEFSTLINKIQKDKPFILFIFKNEEFNPEDFKTFKILNL